MLIAATNGAGSLLVFLAFAIGIPIAVFGGYKLLVLMNRKHKEFREEALSRGDIYVREQDWAGAFPGSPFDAGHSREGDNITYGDRNGKPVISFTYQWKITTGSGKSRRTETHERHVTAMWIGGAIPPLIVHRESKFSYSPNDFATDSIEFNDNYRVFPSDPKSAMGILHPRMMEYLNSMKDVMPGFIIYNGWMYSPYSNAGNHYVLQDAYIEYFNDILAGVPNWVLNDYGVGAEQTQLNPYQAASLIFPMIPSVSDPEPSIWETLST